MKKVSATPINPQSWILSEWGNRVGVLSSTPTGLTLLSTDGVKQFESLEHLQRSLSWSIQFPEPAVEQEAVDSIDGFPVRHKNPQNIETEPVTSYTKTATSNVRLAAGYWGIKYAHGWVPGFCPKLDTLLSYPRIGPFQTKLELNTLLSKQK
jgi:hypothetical protein